MLKGRLEIGESNQDEQWLRIARVCRDLDGKSYCNILDPDT